jgi:excisionase family DNA binding protein
MGGRIVSEQLFTVEQVAQNLNLHVRTIRNYVAAGKLKATRIGKQYRIARSDLDAFTGGPRPALGSRTVGVYSRTDATCVVQIEAISRDSADRLTGGLMGAAKAPRASGAPLNVSAAYDEERDSLRIVIMSSDLRATADLVSMIDAIIRQ